MRWNLNVRSEYSHETGTEREREREREQREGKKKKKKERVEDDEFLHQTPRSIEFKERKREREIVGKRKRRCRPTKGTEKALM